MLVKVSFLLNCFHHHVGLSSSDRKDSCSRRLSVGLPFLRYPHALILGLCLLQVLHNMLELARTHQRLGAGIATQYAQLLLCPLEFVDNLVHHRLLLERHGRS